MTTRRALGTVFQRKSDGRWVVRVTLPDGKRITRYEKDKATAEQALAVLLTTPDLAPVAPYTVATWLDEFLIRDARGKAASTSKDRHGLAQGIKNSPLARIRLDRLTPAQVQRWADAQTGAHRGRLKRLQLLRAALNQAMILGHVSRNVAAPVKLERQPTPQRAQAWSKAESAHFLAVNAESRHILLWTLGFQTGARIGELLALRLEDYDPLARTLRIERTIKTSASDNNRKDVGPPKTPSSIRTFPMGRTAQATVEAQLVARVTDTVPSWQEEGWLFPNLYGGLLMYNSVHQEWLRSLDRAPTLKRLRMHDMRTTFISLAIRHGAKQEVVAKLVGHKDSTITMRVYRQVYGEEMEDVRDLLDAI